MQASKTDFFYTEVNQPHPERARAMIKQYPQIRDLFGSEWMTIFLIFELVLFQTIIAIVLGMIGFGQYWWLSVAAAYLFGAFFNHSTFIMIHECAHNAVFTRKIWNRFAACLVDLVNVFPSAEGFRVYHIRHHAHQGDYEFDADLPYFKEAKMIGNNPIFKALWLLFFPVFQGLRPLRLKNIKMWNPWVILNAVCTISFSIFLGLTFGWNAVFYLFLSFCFSIGLHPLGARWIQEHYTPEGNLQESFNYEGSLNIISFNVGLHNEHHDFPNVSWSKLPQLRKIAPEFYVNLEKHTSWFKLFFNFLFDPRYDLYSRVLRTKIGKVDADPEFLDRNENVLAKFAAEIS